MNRKLGFLVGLLFVLPLSAEDTRRYLVSARQPVAASRFAVAANVATSPRHALRMFPNAGTFAANLTADEAAELQRSGDFTVERIVARSADGFDDAAPAALGFNEEVHPPQEVPWGITNIRAAEVWPHSRGENVNVVVIDTGIDANHPDLKDAYQGGFNAFDPTKPPVDLHRHGTHVAGTVAAADNAIGVVGVAPKVKLWAAKVLDDDGEGTNETVVAAIDWTIAKAKALGGRWVINMSLGSSVPSEAEEKAIANANAEGIIVVASAGNRASDRIRYPASYHGVIAVGAAEKSGVRANFSSYGHYMTLMAPGTEIRSTFIAGYDVSADVVAPSGATLGAWSLIGAPYASATGLLFDCGVGDPESFPAGVRGHIALIRRGKFKFREMARNAQAAGAIAIVIETFPDRDGVDTGGWSFFPNPPDPSWDGYEWPLGIGVTRTTGDALLAQQGEITVSNRTARYGLMQGTSMAAPHVTGTVALLLSLAPSLSVAQTEYVLRATARDVYEPGWDYDSSWGVLDALAAAKWVAYEKFGVPAPKPAPAHRRRSAR
ncbi:MAG TPA: S8 family serine peptidase [Thermoanaerobaculia bacterium]|nr:S8 family serine peptidase [Thermoanaerobaculia bacterium]